MSNGGGALVHGLGAFLEELLFDGGVGVDGGAHGVPVGWQLFQQLCHRVEQLLMRRLGQRETGHVLFCFLKTFLLSFFCIKDSRLCRVSTIILGTIF